MKFLREFAMPSRWTFEIPAVRQFIMSAVDGASVVVDPFAGRSEIGTVRNDLAVSRMTATEWLDSLIVERGESWADAVLLDPPYSPRQISECYKSVGLSVTGQDTQNSRVYREAIERLTAILRVGGVAIRCGWNSNGFGITRGFHMDSILLVQHGGAHNDTIVTAETLVEKQQFIGGAA